MTTTYTATFRLPTAWTIPVDPPVTATSLTFGGFSLEAVAVLLNIEPVDVLASIEESGQCGGIDRDGHEVTIREDGQCASS
jgi:hypothetical protein